MPLVFSLPFLSSESELLDLSFTDGLTTPLSGLEGFLVLTVVSSSSSSESSPAYISIIYYISDGYLDAFKSSSS